jgi:transforming growth factor-beta-induced protein
MKKQLVTAGIFFLFASLLISCKKDEQPPTAGKTIAEIVSTDANFSLLKKAVDKAGLGAALSSGTLTVFAPDNDAFAASGITEAALNSLTKEQVAGILTYHVIGSKYVSTSIPSSGTLPTLSGINAYPTKSPEGVFINTVKVKSPDIIATNGVIHVISKVLMPATITDIVVLDPNFSILKAAVVRAGLANALSTGTFTVFAPDNAAFAASGLNEAAINSLPVADLTNILLYHAVGAVVPSTAVPASDTVNTLLTTNLYASKNANGVFLNGISVKAADVKAANGVIHVVSKVLIPPTKTIAEIVSSDPELSTLLGAVGIAGLVNAVSTDGKYTVFAPTNTAFAPLASVLGTLTNDQITSIVKSHVLSTNVFASDLISGQKAPTLEAGKSLLVGTNPPSVKIDGSSNPVSNIIVPNGVNIIATNGVIHKIDRVLQ